MKPGAGKKKIVILSDRMPLKNRLINLGDRAMMDGSYRVLSQNPEVKLISGGWKNIPFFNMRDFRKVKSADEIKPTFDAFLNRMEASCKKRLRHEQTILSLLTGPKIKQNPFISSVDTAFSKRYSRGFTETLLPFLFRLPGYHALKQKLLDADIVMYNGAALVADHLDFYLPSYLFECYLAKQLGKRVITMNQSIAVSKPLNRQMIQEIYGMLDSHMTREPAATEELIALGFAQKRIITSCDTAFAADYHADPQTVLQLEGKNSLEGGGIGIALRGDMNADLNKLAAMVSFIKQNLHKNVYYISTCKPHDMPLFKKLTRIADIRLLDDGNHYPLAMHLMKKLDLVITDRYHTAIFAIIAGTPILPFKPQTRKTEGLFSFFDYPFKIKAFNECPLSFISDDIRYAISHKLELAEKITHAASYLRNKVCQDIRLLLERELYQ